MIYSNLIKSNDDPVIKIQQMDFWQRGLEEDSTESQINEFDFDFAEK